MDHHWCSATTAVGDNVVQDCSPVIAPTFLKSSQQVRGDPEDIFDDDHRKMIAEASLWLSQTSQACSVVATLIATVAFATAATVPGGGMDQSGTPVLGGKPAFDIFSVASLVAVGFSLASVALFLSILTSRHHQAEFEHKLPIFVILGLTTLFVSITAMLISFCGGHFFLLSDNFKIIAYPMYVVTCLPVTLFSLAHIPLYIDLVCASFTSVAQRTYN